MREIEWKVLCELMKNSRLSDRELAIKIGSSQPTVTRARRRLEQNGIIKEYTVIPDFAKLGFGVMALTFSHFASVLNKEEVEEVKKVYRERPKEAKHARVAASLQIVMQERGRGLGYDGVTISFHKDYKSFLEFMKLARQDSYVALKNHEKPYPVLKIDDIDSFLVNLNDEVHYCPLTFSTLAKHLLSMNETKR